MRGERLTAAAIVVALAASIQGCGKPVLRVADASLGDYYTENEFKKLSKEQREEYCAELARQDSIYKVELTSMRTELDAIQSRSMRLRLEGDSLFALADAIRDGGPANAGPGRVGRLAGATVHVVRSGESLWGISARRGVYGRGARWERIFEANRDLIQDPNLIYPGQKLSIPR